MQVYRGMDIGTAKPTAIEQTAVRHHLIDLVDPHERYTVTRFAAAAAAALADIEARGATAILVGGTGLHLQAVLGDVVPPGEWPDVRAELEGEPPRALHARLATLDPVAAARIDPDNGRRSLRALEVTIGSGRPFSSFGPGLGAYEDRLRFAIAGIWLPRAVLALRIERRVDAMLEAGLVEEVRRLEPGMGPYARQALGYREIIAGLGASEIVARTRQFARRQRSWFRRDPRIRWHGTSRDPDRLLPGLAAELDRCGPPTVTP
ncbi:MAG: hypothetical protein NVS1B12_14610 [Acidimicrobiales bacterium]